MARSAFLLLALALAPAAARADDPPQRKPGLWDVTISRDGGAPATKMQMCLDAASQTHFDAMGKEAMKDVKCSKRESHRDGKVFTMDSVCEFMGSTQTTHMIVTAVSDEEFTMDMTIHTDPPRKHGKADVKMTQRSHWLGACAADMKPGDMIIRGRKVHPGAKP